MKVIKNKVISTYINGLIEVQKFLILNKIHLNSKLQIAVDNDISLHSPIILQTIRWQFCHTDSTAFKNNIRTPYEF